MTALDWILLLIVGISALLGVMRGLIGIAVSLVAWLLAGLAAYVFGDAVGRSLVTDGQAGWGEYLGGYALSFAVVWITVSLLGLLLRRIAHSAGLSPVDRVFGLGLGMVRGVFFACVLLLLLGLTGVPARAAWRDSAGVALLLPGATWLRACLPAWMQQRVDLERGGRPLPLPAAIPEGLPSRQLQSADAVSPDRPSPDGPVH